MTQTQHTPTPYMQKAQSDKAGDGWTRIVNLGSGTEVAKISSIHKKGQRKAGDFEIEEANAEFIVRACNSFDDMLEALENVAIDGNIRGEFLSYIQNVIQKARGEI